MNTSHNDIYFKKYMIYKNKYLNLKNQTGGNITQNKLPDQEKYAFLIENDKSIPTNIRIMNAGTFIFDSANNIVTSLMEYKNEQDTINVLKIILNNPESDKPSLIVIPGISTESVVKNAEILLTRENIDLLKQKFDKIYIFEHSFYKTIQDNACTKRNELSPEIKECKNFDLNQTKGEYYDNFSKFYQPENEVNNMIAKFIFEIIKINELNNIHLLGISNGGWISTLLLQIQECLEIVKGFYLCNPACPYGMENVISTIPYEVLTQINFLFGFVQQDSYVFPFGKSNQESSKYRLQMCELNNHFTPLKYKSILYNKLDDSGKIEEPHPKSHHKLYPEMISDIVKTL